jgi:hypothetical protein
LLYATPAQLLRAACACAAAMICPRRCFSCIAA